MKLIHLSDLHLGKRVNEFSMLEDQAYILNRILEIIDEEQPDGVLIAGDVYDKTIPPVEAVELLDQFLVSLGERKRQVFLIAGNHDSAERIAFGGRLMEERGIHIAPVYDGNVCPTVLTDEYGELAVYLLPFVKPVHVRRSFPEENIESYTDAVALAVEHMSVDVRRRNVLVTHQFVTGAVRSESEEISVGGTDNVDCAVFDAFDYVALGHLHRPQPVGRETIRYCGTPLKYSFSEADHEKSVTVVELREKGDVSVRTVKLEPLRELRHLKGTYDEFTSRSFYIDKTYRAEYLHITLTDEEDVPDAIGKLRSIYPYIMRLDYDNTRTAMNQTIDGAEAVEQKSPMELFSELFELQNNAPMSREQSAFVTEIMESIWEERA